MPHDAPVRPFGRKDQRIKLKGCGRASGFVVGQELLQFPGMVHLDHDVGPADQFPFDIQLGKRGPVRVNLQALPNLGILEDVDVGKRFADCLQCGNGLAREAALREVGSALHVQQHGTVADLIFDSLIDVHSYVTRFSVTYGSIWERLYAIQDGVLLVAGIDGNLIVQLPNAAGIPGDPHSTVPVIKTPDFADQGHIAVVRPDFDIVSTDVGIGIIPPDDRCGNVIVGQDLIGTSIVRSETAARRPGPADQHGTASAETEHRGQYQKGTHIARSVVEQLSRLYAIGALRVPAGSACRQLANQRPLLFGTHATPGDNLVQGPCATDAAVAVVQRADAVAR